MLAALDRTRHRSLARAHFTLSHAVETFLDPIAIVLCLFATALWYGESIEAPYMVLSLIVFSLSFPGTLQ